LNRSVAVNRPLSVVLSSIIILIGSISTLVFHQNLRSTELASIERSLAERTRYVRSDLLANVDAEIRALLRMTSRLQASQLTQEAQWRADALRYQADHPYYRILSVLRPDLSPMWTQYFGDPTLLNPELPDLNASSPGLVESARQTGELVISEPFDLGDGRKGMAFLSPIGQGESHLGFLSAVLSVPEAIDALISDIARDDLALRVMVDHEQIYPLPVTAWPEHFQWRPGFYLEPAGMARGLYFQFAYPTESSGLRPSATPTWVLIGGLALSLLLATMTYLGLAAARQAERTGASNLKLEREVRERKLIENELEFLATHDPLTGLPNRSGASRHLERMLSSSLASDEPLALFFLDLDQFKDINDSLGHQFGDELLRQIPARLNQVLRKTDFVGRHGGDEFLIALHRTSRPLIEQAAANVLDAFDEAFSIEGNQFFISASIGIAYYPESGRTVSDLIQNADTALFKAKNAGRNQFAVFTPEMFDQAQHRLNLSRDIRRALDGEQFRVKYQPIVDVQTLELVGVEALLRWRNDEGFMVPPQDFIRVAEETGMIGRLGRFALRQALSDLGRWQARTGRPPWLAVNVSGAQILEATFADQLSVLLHQHGIDPAILHLEITEEVLIENLNRNRRTLQKLSDIGMQIVVDDFGVGYSSLAYLKNFPVSVVKIDRGFIQDLSRDAEDQAITRTICGLSRELGMTTVAEGVEHIDQLSLLRRFNCTYAQGFLFAQAVEPDDIEDMIIHRSNWMSLMTPADP
jgi:diguanylate cyclase (GGDEF)-like protein